MLESILDRALKNPQTGHPNMAMTPLQNEMKHRTDYVKPPYKPSVYRSRHPLAEVLDIGQQPADQLGGLGVAAALHLCRYSPEEDHG